MIGWKRLKRPRKGCTEIVIDPRPRRGRYYLTPCGRRAPWRPAKQFFKNLRYCEEHKTFLDTIDAEARKSRITFVMKTYFRPNKGKAGHEPP